MASGGACAALLFAGCLLTTSLDELSVGGGGSSGAPVDAGSEGSGEASTDASKPDAPPTNGTAITFFRFLDVDSRAIPNGLESITGDVTVKLTSIANCTLEAVSDPEEVGSVRFEIDGSEVNIENSAPYYILGDRGSNIFEWNPSPGTVEVTATPYSAQSGGGTFGKALTVRFTIEP